MRAEIEAAVAFADEHIPEADEAITRIARTTGRDAADARRALEKLNPQRRLIQPDEVAWQVAALVEHGARGINGQALAIDGGQVT